MEQEFLDALQAARIVVEKLEHWGRVRSCGCGDVESAAAGAIDAMIKLNAPLTGLLQMVKRPTKMGQNSTRCRYDSLCSHRRNCICIASGEPL